MWEEGVARGDHSRAGCQTHRKPEFLRLQHMGTAPAFPPGSSLLCGTYSRPKGTGLDFIPPHSQLCSWKLAA